jgi:hypothetical protein
VKKDEVPQDQAGALEGQRKAMYAIDSDGKYAVVPSTGWEAEDAVLQQAIEYFTKQAADALARYYRGEASPLEFHMYNNRMDVTLLAQSTGIFKWRVRRHLKPAVFARLPARDLDRYCEALGIAAAELRSVPTE